MNKKQKKLTGKEQAKINKRKKFYNKLERISRKISNDNLQDQVILIEINKKLTFPEYDELSLLFQNDFSDEELKINLDTATTLSFPYLDDARFLVTASRAKVIKIIRQETFVEDDGSERRGSSGTDDSYNYQSAFNWGFIILNVPKLLERLEKEKENPTTYILKQKMKKIQKQTYQRAWKPPNRRKSK
ncbi:MAG: hypothetical protein ACXAC7_17270 [Candidatus Hodarchaeales archaeon]